MHAPAVRSAADAGAPEHPRTAHARLAPAQMADPDAFAALYARHSSSVYASAYRVLGRAADAADVTQDVFLRLWSKPSRFDPERGELDGYLRLMARSRALDVWRQRQAGARAEERLRTLARDDDVPVDEHPARAAERDGHRSTIRQALGRLPESQREAVVLSFWGDLTAAEVARRSRVPLGTAKSRIRLGIEKLRSECAAALADLSPSTPPSR